MRRLRVLLLALSVAMSLTTANLPGQAAPGRLLLIVNAGAPNPFGRYLSEILEAEGIASFTTVELSALDRRALTSAPLAVLAETPLTAPQAALIREYVEAGGRLVAMRPDPQLFGVVGVSAIETGGGDERYVAFDITTPTSSGLPRVTLPMTGPAAHYRVVPGTATVARLYGDRDTPADFPAVIRSGRTASWAYDLARSVAYARQGDPVNAGSDRDGHPPIRSEDVFYRAIDLERVSLPHADFQMRLFSRLIEDLLLDAGPLPRLWYFPGESLTLMVATADSHIHSEKATRDQIASIEARGGRLTTYVSRWVPHPTAAEASAWREGGHEFGLHPYGAQDDVSLEAGFRAAVGWFNEQGPRKPSRTTRTHQIEWTSWVGPADLEASYHIGLDTTFYTWGPAVTYPDGRQAHGFITGSGLPMRFVDEKGRIIAVYQQATSIIDEQLVVGDNSEHLSPPDALAVSRKLIDESLAGGYSALVTQFHTDTYSWSEVLPWAEGTLDYAKAHGIPIWTAERWLNYTEARAATEVTALVWAPPVVSFAVTVPARAEPQTILLPAVHAGRGMASLTVDGGAAPLATHTISGRDAVFVTVGPGTHRLTASYTAAAPPPVSQPPPPAAEPSPVAQRVEPAPVAPPPPASGDFTCGTLAGTILTGARSGEVQLAGAFGADYARGKPEPGRWVMGTWGDGAFAPVPSSGILSIASPSGAFVRSATALKVTTIEASARFSGAAWEHIGWGALDFSGPFLLFSTANTSTNLHARTSSDGKSEQRADLGPIPAGFHTYRIDRTAQSPATDLVTYFVDGVQRAQHTLATLPPLYAYQSHNGGAAPPLDVQRLWVYPPHVATGSYESCAIDGSAAVSWGEIRWGARVPDGTGIEVSTRTSTDERSWSAWSEPVAATGGPVSSPPGRFLQYRLVLRSGSPSVSPVVESVTVTHGLAATVR